MGNGRHLGDRAAMTYLTYSAVIKIRRMARQCKLLAR